MRLVTVDTTRHARRFAVGLEDARDDRDERRRQRPGGDELEHQVRDPERGEERVEVGRRVRTRCAMTTRRTQPSTRETRNAPETMSPARARVRAALTRRPAGAPADARRGRPPARRPGETWV